MLKKSDVLVCNRCKQTGKLFRYSFNKVYQKYYPHRECRECAVLRTLEWIAKNPEQHRKNSRAVDATPKRKLKCRIRNKRVSAVLWDAELTNLVTTEAHHVAQLREDITKSPWHVDHIIPLNGELVSGLHVWNNLQVIPASVNLSKGNKETTKCPS